MSDWICIFDELPPIGEQVLFTNYTDHSGWSDVESGEWTGRWTRGDAIVMDYGDNDGDWYPCSCWMRMPELPKN